MTKQSLIRFLLLINVGVGLLFVLPLLNVYLQAGLFLGFAILCMSLVSSAGILHPIAWFSPFFWSYSVVYPVVAEYGSGGPYGYAEEAIPLAFSGYLAFTSVCYLFTSPRRTTFSNLKPLRGASGAALLFIPVVLAGVALVLVGGVASKRDYLLVYGGGLLAYMIFAFQVPAAGAVLATISKYCRGYRIKSIALDKFIMLISACAVIVYGATGERDHLFRLLLMIGLFVYAAYFRYRVLHVWLATAALFVVLPISHAAKAFMLADSPSIVGIGRSLEGSDFASAGFVFNYVLMRRVDWLGGQSLLDAVKRVFFIEPEAASATAWLHNDIRQSYGDEGASGWGFSLVAEGYVNFGSIGPAIVLGLVAIMASMIYRRAKLSTLTLLYYLLFAGSAIYAIRADMANLLVQTLHHNVAIVIYFWGVSMVLTYFVRKGSGNAQR